MSNIVEFIIVEKLDVSKLNRQHTIETLFYVSQMLKEVSAPSKLAQYEQTKIELEDRLKVLRNRSKENVFDV